jgi:magnesium transporter
MNFEYMPELKSPWGYPAVLLFMLIVALSLLIFMKRRRWF